MEPLHLRDINNFGSKTENRVGAKPYGKAVVAS
jgi:hypothetical protein